MFYFLHCLQIFDVALVYFYFLLESISSNGFRYWHSVVQFHINLFQHSLVSNHTHALLLQIAISFRHSFLCCFRRKRLLDETSDSRDFQVWRMVQYMSTYIRYLPSFTHQTLVKGKEDWLRGWCRCFVIRTWALSSFYVLIFQWN